MKQRLSLTGSECMSTCGAFGQIPGRPADVPGSRVCRCGAFLPPWSWECRTSAESSRRSRSAGLNETHLDVFLIHISCINNSIQCKMLNTSRTRAWGHRAGEQRHVLSGCVQGWRRGHGLKLCGRVMSPRPLWWRGERILARSCKHTQKPNCQKQTCLELIRKKQTKNYMHASICVHSKSM